MLTLTLNTVVFNNVKRQITVCTPIGRITAHLQKVDLWSTLSALQMVAVAHDAGKSPTLIKNEWLQVTLFQMRFLYTVDIALITLLHHAWLGHSISAIGRLCFDGM